MTSPGQPRIAITGSGGLVGGDLAARLADGYQVRAFSRSPGPGREPLGDLLRPGAISEFDHILHLAWSQLPVTADASSTGNDSDLTLLGSLLDAIAALPADHRPVPVFFSSGAVYGNAWHEGGSTENDVPAPLGRYAAKKREAELLIQHHTETHGFPALILRISNLYGSLPSPDRPQGVIPKILTAALTGVPFRLWGIDAKKDYLHMDDFEQALRAILTGGLSGIYNVSHGDSCFTSALIEAVESVTGRPIEVVREEAKDFDVTHSLISREKLSRETDWAPRIDLHSGIEKLLARYLRERQTSG